MIGGWFVSGALTALSLRVRSERIPRDMAEIQLNLEERLYAVGRRSVLGPFHEQQRSTLLLVRGLAPMKWPFHEQRRSMLQLARGLAPFVCGRGRAGSSTVHPKRDLQSM